jgi:cytochrome c-type biogenesis protein CcmE
MKFKYLIILIAISSLLALYLLSLVSHPALISISEIQTYNGQQVIVQGIVTDYRTTAYDSQLVTIRDTENTTQSITLYIEGDVSVDYGDVIQVIGEVHLYKGQWELIVNTPQAVILLEKWNNESTPLWHLAEYPGNYLDTTVNITGIATQKHTTSYILTDPTGTYSIDVSYDIAYPHQFSNGDTVMVIGRFLYDPTTLHYLMITTESTHGIWKIAGQQDA